MNSIFDKNGECMGDCFLNLYEIETMIQAIKEEGKRKKRHYVIKYPDGLGNWYSFSKHENIVYFSWWNTSNRIIVERTFYADTGTLRSKETSLRDMDIGKKILYTKFGNVEQVIDYEADFSTPLDEIITLYKEEFNVDILHISPMNPSEFSFSRVIFKEHPTQPRGHILSFFPKQGDDSKKRIIVIKDSTKEIVIDRLVDQWIETRVDKDTIIEEPGYIPNREIIKALTNKSKITYNGQILIEEQEYQRYLEKKNKKGFWERLFGG